MLYSLASLTELGLAPIGIPCLCSASIRTSRISLLYESKSKTFRTTLAKPSSGNFCWEERRRRGDKGRRKGEINKREEGKFTINISSTEGKAGHGAETSSISGQLKGTNLFIVILILRSVMKETQLILSQNIVPFCSNYW